MREEIIGGARLILGDNRQLAIAPSAALIGDPPYGISERTDRKSKGRSSTRLGVMVESRDWPAIRGDNRPFDPAFWLRIAPKVILWGANHYCSRLPDASRWLVWDKREETGPDDNADCEFAWTNLGGAARIHRQLWRGICRRGEENVANEGRSHPTQKPVSLMAWCIQQCRLHQNDMILDPWMGSGATGVAAARAGHPFTGIEIEETYFDTACRRIEQATRQRDLFVSNDIAAA